MSVYALLVSCFPVELVRIIIHYIDLKDLAEAHLDCSDTVFFCIILKTRFNFMYTKLLSHPHVYPVQWLNSHLPTSRVSASSNIVYTLSSECILTQSELEDAFIVMLMTNHISPELVILRLKGYVNAPWMSDCLIKLSISQTRNVDPILFRRLLDHHYFKTIRYLVEEVDVPSSIPIDEMAALIVRYWDILSTNIIIDLILVYGTDIVYIQNHHFSMLTKILTSREDIAVDMLQYITDIDFTREAHPKCYYYQLWVPRLLRQTITARLPPHITLRDDEILWTVD